MHWRIYYESGGVLDGDALPVCCVGVLVIAQADDRLGREIVDGGDWYYCRKGRWYAADTFGLMDQILYHLPEISCVLQGRMVGRETFDVAVIRACDEPGLPRKSAHRKTERL